MKKEKLLVRIAFIVLYSLILIAEFIALGLAGYNYSYFILIPALFLVPIYLTFDKVPQGTDKKVGILILLILARYFLVISACLIPALLYYFIPAIKESVLGYAFFIPGAEILGVYFIVFIQYVYDGHIEAPTKA